MSLYPLFTSHGTNNRMPVRSLAMLPGFRAFLSRGSTSSDQATRRNVSRSVACLASVNRDPSGSSKSHTMQLALADDPGVGLSSHQAASYHVDLEETRTPWRSSAGRR